MALARSQKSWCVFPVLELPVGQFLGQSLLILMSQYFFFVIVNDISVI